MISAALPVERGKGKAIEPLKPPVHETVPN
jgi:hypothetical protein